VIVSTVKKSVARIPLAWARRNWLQVGPERRGAGGSRWRRRTVATLVLETMTPSFFKLTDDAEISPARVLSCKTNDQFDGLLRQGRAAGLRVGVGPSPLNEVAVTAKDRLRRNEQGGPPCAGDEAGEGTDERSIRPCEARPGNLAPEDGQLMAQHKDLGILGQSVRLMNPDSFEHAVDEAIEEGKPHRQRASLSRSHLVKHPLDE
jgi:hypothetical protein